MFVLLLALLIIAALQWNSFGESMTSGSRPVRRVLPGIATLLKNLSSTSCGNRATSSVIETLQLPPPHVGEAGLTREYALQPAIRSPFRLLPHPDATRFSRSPRTLSD